MIKLSQRAWNNVIIVSMLILIVLFNFSGNFLNDNNNQASPRLTLVPAGMVITTMQFEKQKIERIGQGWRSLTAISDKELNNQNLASLVEHWQSAEMSLFEQSLSWQTPTSSVQLWFAGQALPIEYQFIQLADKTLVKLDNQTYQLISPSYQMLTLSE